MKPLSNPHPLPATGSSVEIRSIAVLGAGQMGSGIAQVAACAGYEVTMIDIEQSFVERGMEAIGNSLGKLVAKERMSQREADSALARVRAKLADKCPTCLIHGVRVGVQCGQRMRMHLAQVVVLVEDLDEEFPVAFDSEIALARGDQGP